MNSPFRGALFVVLVALFTTVPWLSTSDFYSRGEPREALVAQSMLTTGDFILPAGYGDAIPSKPPFDHWLISLFSLITGDVTEFTARLPSALGSVLFALCFYLFLHRRIGAGQAVLSSFFTLTSFEWVRSASSCRVDMVHAASLAGALLSLLAWHERALRGVSISAILLLIASFLSKGPVGLVLPLSCFAAFLLIERQRPTTVIVKCGITAILVLLPGLLWYLLAWAQGGDRFFDKVYYENVARFTGTMHDKPHNHSVLYLFGVSFLGLLPWSFLALPALLMRLRHARRPAFRTWTEIERLSLVAACGIFLFYSMSSRRTHFSLCYSRGLSSVRPRLRI
jgi:4-amino-4-deoxy-L-arabinose transferase-like glycosyltransferase